LHLTEEEHKAITALHRKVHDMVHAIGQVEVQKARILADLADTENEAQVVMHGASVRMGIPQGKVWKAQPDGTVVILPDPPQPAPSP
jgi:hypothetical protein